jgi:hypothetical protein
VNDNLNTAFHLQTAAPVAVHQCEVISVIAEELFGCFSIGYGYALAVSLDIPNEATSRADISWSAFETTSKVDMSPPQSVDHIAEAALESVKQWAKDVNAFYNNELLKAMVYKLCNDYFEIGTLARPNTVDSFLCDFRAGIDEAMQACNTIDRSAAA